ncbi:hypothetical protein [Aestuariimicrobium ganziense]|uniref:hypothetical protein n=1 Tax=Aestuariimicrobium ganziense TaxID=2773677 RepID=UPI0019439602|nr:hypothetical protein [Aestuariimicrobium ganziense]
MRVVRRVLLGIALLQALSTLVGSVQLLVVPRWYAPMLDRTVFAGQYVLAALLLGVVVGGFQWAAIIVHRRRPRWLAVAHSLAGLVMVGWIAGECLVLNSFIWPHALWGGLGVAQLVLVQVLLGVLLPQPAADPTR